MAVKGSTRDLWPNPATIPGSILFVVEGEPDAVTATQLGLPAVAIPGTGKFDPGWPVRIAEGRDRVVIITDADAPGRKAAKKWAAAVAEHCADVRVLDLEPGRDDGYDLSDYAAAAKTDVDRAALRRCIMGAAEHAEKVVVVVPGPRETTTTTPDRYAGRVVDLDALLSKPPQPIPWRVHDVVADGTLTIISGESGAGKSWLVQALCTGVALGRAVAGLPCVEGTALYIDAEMGPRMFVDQRLRPTDATVAPFKYVDAMGLDISTPDDLAWVRSQIERMGANLVVIDSLRRLTPSKAENDSDDMAPAVAALAKLARDTDAAIVLVHHKGDSDKFFRGSTAIKDQADALFARLRHPDDEHAPRRFRCSGGKGKMRYAPEPADVFLTVDPEAGGVAGSDPPEDTGPQVSAREAVTTAIKAALPAKTKKEVADKVGRRTDDKTFRDAWNDLRAAGELAEINGVWEGGGSHQPLGNPTTTPLENGSSKPNEGDPREWEYHPLFGHDPDADLERIAAKFPDMFGGAS